MSPLVVQVLDQNSRPVDGAQVVFRFPLRGPSAVFPNQQTSQTARTNADGQAAAVGWVANNQAGSFQVQVSASRGNELGSATISMTNATRVVPEDQTKHKSKWSSKWVKIGIIAGAMPASPPAWFWRLGVAGAVLWQYHRDRIAGLTYYWRPPLGSCG